jgi:predicted acyltransferase
LVILHHLAGRGKAIIPSVSNSGFFTVIHFYHFFLHLWESAFIIIMEKIKSDDRRIASVDVLRGFDMFWLVGGTGLAIAIVKLFGGSVQEILLPQLDHAEWIGFTFYDLIFPLFEFVMGMSVVFSLQKILKKEGKTAAYSRLIRRFILLYLLGFIYYGGFSQLWPDIRILGVLQRLAITYLLTGILFIHLELRGMVIVSACILIGYWILFSFIPVPDKGIISLTPDSNWAQYIDARFLPGKKNGPAGAWDVVGILGTIPATVSCVLGVFAAQVLQSKKMTDKQRLICLIGGGLALVVTGYLWGIQFPVIKKVWTSTYVLVSGGYSFMLMGIFYFLIDVRGYKKWTTLFVWIGVNPITIYMARNLIDFNGPSKRLVGGDIALVVGEQWAYVLATAVSLAFSLILLRFMYNRKIFIKV